jgi:DUF971 family protein
MNPRISTIKTTDDYKLHLTFTNGQSGIYDCNYLLDFGVFKKLQDIETFKKAKVAHGTVVWPHNLDICPDTLYLDSQK